MSILTWYKKFKDVDKVDSLDNLLYLAPRKKPIVFACIGTDRSTGDSLGPLVGTFLEELGYDVVGTLKEPMHGMNIHEKIELIKEKYPNHFIVAIDACLGNSKDIGDIIVHKGSLFPGKAVKKDLPPVGDVSIKGIVNVGGFMEYDVLQSTRLNLVWEMSREIVQMCDIMMKGRKKRKKLKVS